MDILLVHMATKVVHLDVIMSSRNTKTQQGKQEIGKMNREQGWRWGLGGRRMVGLDLSTVPHTFIYRIIGDHMGVGGDHI